MIFDIRERTKKFAIRIVILVKMFPRDIAGQQLGKQLIRSGMSIGANLEEADAAPTRNDFFHKVTISYKEARETRYWLEIVLETKLLNNPKNIQEAEFLMKEAIELSKILFSILKGKQKTAPK